MSIDKRSICIIGVPIDLGAGRRGVDMGPSAIRVADIDKRLEGLGFDVEDCGNLDVMIPETQQVGQGNMRFKGPILAACGELRLKVKDAMTRGRFPIVLGGDHSLAIGSIAGVSDYFHEQNERVGVIWFDAHGDFNTPETTPSGNIHGMSLAVSVGRGDAELVGLGGRSPKIDPATTVIIGARDIDEHEKKLLRESGVTVFTMRNLDERGMRRVFEDAIDIVSQGTAGVHLSFDLDVVDPEFAPGTGTPVRGGVSYREAHLAMEMLSDNANVVSMDMVEVNPVLDTQNKTAMLGVELLLSLMGKRII